MKSYPTCYRWLPEAVRVPLFGDRARYGTRPDPADPMWAAWLATYERFYESTQKRSVGAVVNDAGYRVLRHVDLTGRRVLEVGPGKLPHLRWWRGRPAEVVLVDVHAELLARARARLASAGIAHAAHVVEREAPLPFPPESFDVILSFYVFEHIHPFGPYLARLRELLRPGGVLVGAIPAEGGLAWGLGRALTTRRWLRRHTEIDPDKIICWEHPTFADTILRELDTQLDRERREFWPLRVPLLDVNLVVRFVHRRVGTV